MHDNREDLPVALSQIAWGYLFLLLDFNLGALNVLPNWAGFLLIHKALPAVAQEQPSASLLAPLVVLLGGVEGVSWLLAMAEISLPRIVSLLFVVVNLYVHFQLLTNLADLADQLGQSHGKGLRVLRNVYALLQTCLALPLPWERVPPAAYLALGVTLVLLIALLSHLFSLRNAIAAPPEKP